MFNGLNCDQQLLTNMSNCCCKIEKMTPGKKGTTEAGKKLEPTLSLTSFFPFVISPTSTFQHFCHYQSRSLLLLLLLLLPLLVMTEARTEVRQLTSVASKQSHLKSIGDMCHPLILLTLKTIATGSRTLDRFPVRFDSEPHDLWQQPVTF